MDAEIEAEATAYVVSMLLGRPCPPARECLIGWQVAAENLAHMIDDIRYGVDAVLAIIAPAWLSHQSESVP